MPAARQASTRTPAAPAVALVLSLYFHRLGLVDAWWDTGHMLVAAVALKSLPKAQVEEASLLLDIYKEAYPAASTFVSASHWADDIKRNHDAYAFSGWHFIDFPYPSRDACSQDTVEKQNIVFALESLRNTLKKTASPAWSRAFALRFIIHLIGDMHQPLHTVSRCSPNHPKGDAGGNLFKLSGTYNNLHKLWDAMGGQYADSIAKLCPYGEWETCEKQESEREAAVISEAASLIEEFPRESFANETFGPGPEDAWGKDILMSWARSSYAVVSSNPRVYGDVTENAEPSEDYVKFVKATTRRRVVLGGYRLGRFLSENMPQSDSDAKQIEKEEQEDAAIVAADTVIILLSLLCAVLMACILWLLLKVRKLGWAPKCYMGPKQGAMSASRSERQGNFILSSV